ncbi:protein MIS12 homolog [Phoenix dactylifera]|uniref:Protein MIS12 homolog n=1 Tax=Phoenix dactylifera TaxID=42345 RepID=A0A8B8ZQC5_PHODC|nr:protein MIS12 homolog [Phoenix dactylifera]
MEGGESEAVFEAFNLNPQRFINEVLNAVDDMLDGAFDFFLQQATVITGGGTERTEELARGVSSLRHLTQAVLDKRMAMWEKYCLRHCFAVPEGFVLPKAKESSGDSLSIQKGLSDPELDAQLESLRENLAAAGKKSAELHEEMTLLEKQSTLSCSYDASVADALQLFEENPVHDMFQEIGKTALELHHKMVQVKMKRWEDMEQARVAKIHNSSREQPMLHDTGISARLEDIEEVLSILRSK